MVDASPVGISANLAQREKDSQQYKVIAYASRSLTPVEKRYSQTDREGLALVWAIEHYCVEFDIITDNKALEAIYNNPRSKPPPPPPPPPPCTNQTLDVANTAI